MIKDTRFRVCFFINKIVYIIPDYVNLKIPKEHLTFVGVYTSSQLIAGLGLALALDADKAAALNESGQSGGRLTRSHVAVSSDSVAVADQLRASRGEEVADGSATSGGLDGVLGGPGLARLVARV